MSKLLRNGGNNVQKIHLKWHQWRDTGFGLPMDSGAWFLWSDVAEVCCEVFVPEALPETDSFSLQVMCGLARIGDADKEHFQFSVLLRTKKGKIMRPRYERYERVFGIRAMSGHTGTDWLKTFRCAARIQEGDHVWMSVLSHKTLFQNLERIFTTGLVPEGFYQGFSRCSDVSYLQVFAPQLWARKS